MVEGHGEESFPIQWEGEKEKKRQRENVHVQKARDNPQGQAPSDLLPPAMPHWPTVTT